MASQCHNSRYTYKFSYGNAIQTADQTVAMTGNDLSPDYTVGHDRSLYCDFTSVKKWSFSNMTCHDLG